MSPLKGKKGLRSGYTTGACAAAAAKAAVILLLSAEAGKRESGKEKDLRTSSLTRLRTVEIPFPDGSRHTFKVHRADIVDNNGRETATASVIKDGGDDPDITNGAEISATASLVKNPLQISSKSKTRGLRREREKVGKQKNSQLSCFPASILINGGKGVGTVTKPGLPVAVGEPAINPVPRKMIEEAVIECAEELKRGGAEGKNFRSSDLPAFSAIEITISVPDGEELAKKTLNHRLGITGGISILGTTGIVRPVSAEAWKATITSSMDVAKAMGYKEVVLSAGRTSEKAHMKKYDLAEEAYVLMGDHLEYSLKEASAHGFEKAHLCAQWAKMLKIAMATPQTHVRFGAIDTGMAVGFLHSLGIDIPEREYNTAREIFDLITEKYVGVCELPLEKVCAAAKEYAEKTGGIPVTANLVSYDGKVILTCE